MISREKAILNSAAIAFPLLLGLAYAAIADPGIPNSIIIPTSGGALMNFGFWVFYDKSIKPVPILKKICNCRERFLLITALHTIAISILMVYDITWILELFPSI